MMSQGDKGIFLMVIESPSGTNSAGQSLFTNNYCFLHNILQVKIELNHQTEKLSRTAFS